MKAGQIIDEYIKFFKEKDHVQIPNSSLVPENDPSTLFTSSGMQPLVPYLLGEQHPQGRRLVNVQNCFRAQDIDEIGDNRHTTFFRMLGNWSLGDPARNASHSDAGGYFKSEEISWLFEFLTKRLNIDPKRLYVTVFDGYEKIERDTESEKIWRTQFESVNLDPDERIFFYGVDKNWWSRAGSPEKMPIGEPGGPDTEVFYDFGPDLKIHEDSSFANEKCHLNCDCGRYLEIANSVFMQYKKIEKGPEGSSHSPSGTIRTRFTERSNGVKFVDLPQKNVDFGGGLERLVAATENQPDLFRTSLFEPIIKSIENTTAKKYSANQKEMRIIADHLIASVFIASNNVRPSNKEQGYILRRLLRRAFDNFEQLSGDSIIQVVERIVDQYKNTDKYLIEKFEEIKNTILEEEQAYKRTLFEAKKFIRKKYAVGDELKGVTEISADDAFALYTSHGLSPSQIKSLGFMFDIHKFAEKMEEHQRISRAGAKQKFAGGLADHSQQTIKGHTATHLLHQALRDVLGDTVYQTGSNITVERIRFDFNFGRKLTDEEIQKVQGIVNEKIAENLPVHFEIMPLSKAKALRAIGLFDDKYQNDVKVYRIGGPSARDTRSGRLSMDKPYSIEFCGGPHVDFTGELKKFKISRDESLGENTRRIYAVVE